MEKQGLERWLTVEEHVPNFQRIQIPFLEAVFITPPILSPVTSLPTLLCRNLQTQHRYMYVHTKIEK